MSEIQSAEDFIDSVWDIVHCAGGPFTERSGRKQISDLLEADRAAHIALGREMERKRFEACVEALKPFAKMAEQIGESRPSIQGESDIVYGFEKSVLSLGDFHRARKALAELEAAK